MKSVVAERLNRVCRFAGAVDGWMHQPLPVVVVKMHVLPALVSLALSGLHRLVAHGAALQPLGDGVSVDGVDRCYGVSPGWGGCQGSERVAMQKPINPAIDAVRVASDAIEDATDAIAKAGQHLRLPASLEWWRGWLDGCSPSACAAGGFEGSIRVPSSSCSTP